MQRHTANTPQNIRHNELYEKYLTPTTNLTVNMYIFLFKMSHSTVTPAAFRQHLF